MAILYGTTGDGTTLPVLVDQFGNLLAKGIEGPEGPPGPPGIGQLPDDPFEGAILGWEDGELSWLGGSVPLPAGTYGPFIYSNVEATLTVPQDVSALINGQQLYMSDNTGKEVSAVVPTDTIASVGAFAYTPVSTGLQNPENIYKKGTTDKALWQNAGATNLTQRIGISFSSVLKVAVSGYGGNPVNVNCEGVVKTASTNPDNSLKILEFDFGATVTTQPITIYGGSGGFYIHAVYADDTQLVDGKLLTFPSATNFDKFEVGDVVQTELRQEYAVETNQATITGIDANAVPPTITVDGGSWYALPPVGDGSGDPNGQTYIRKSMSGTGSVLVATGNAIVLRSNNGEWIDNYYVTAPEQRIAARKVVTARSQRIAARKVSAAAVEKKTN